MSHQNEKQDLFTQLLGVMADAVIAVNGQQQIVLFNGGAEQLFGYHEVEMLGKPLDVLIPAALRERHRQHVERFAEESYTSRAMGEYIEVQALRKDGSHFFAEATITKVTQDDNLIFMVVLRDVTERWIQHQSLLDSEQRFRQITDTIDEVFFIRDVGTGRYLYLSPAYEVIWGHSPDQTYARPNLFLDTVHPDDQQRVKTSLTQKQMTNCEYRIIRSDGSVRWIYMRAFPVADEGGAIYRTAGIAEDITDRKLIEIALQESEVRYRLLAENATDLLTRHTMDGTCIYASPSCRTLIGYSPEELVQLWGRSFIHPDEWEDLLNAREVLNEHPDQPLRVTYRIQHKDGHYVWFESAARVIPEDVHPEEKNKEGVILVISRDVTDRKRLEQELRASIEKERDLSNLKLRFTSMVSHEFRTPLSIILSSAEILRKYSDDMPQERIEERLNRIFYQATYMRELMDDVLYMGKAQVGSLEFRPRSLNLERFCRDLFDQMKLFATEKHRMVFSIVGKIDHTRMDEGLLQKIIVNLLTNAINYSPDGGEIRFDLRRIGEDVQIRVSDQGIGIPSEDIPNLFVPFHRASNTQGIQGTGLGLAIVSRSVEAHRGQIDVTSKEGLGTTFLIRLPLFAEDAAAT